MKNAVISTLKALESLSKVWRLTLYSPLSIL